MSTLLEQLNRFGTENVARVIWILIIVLAGPVMLRLIANKIVRRFDDGDDTNETGKEKRARTLANLFQTTGNVIIIILALIWTLRLFGIDAYPLLAGATVLGFGVGFGAQTLIKDFFAGIFIFAENQFAVGDRVKFGQVEGTVYKMSIRSTVLIDADGNLIFMPNGMITNVINYSLGEHRKRKLGQPSKTNKPNQSDVAK